MFASGAESSSDRCSIRSRKTEDCRPGGRKRVDLAGSGIFRESLSPLVTAVVTTRARPQFVYEALASVRAETYHDVECLVVDDGGTFDASAVGSDRRVRVVHTDMCGVDGARNAGLAEARGELIIFLDDDDVALPNRISTLMDAATRHCADLCFGMTRRVSLHIRGCSSRTFPHM
jgi:glycosyltransferase involved in cell wall biosynthesis